MTQPPDDRRPMPWDAPGPSAGEPPPAPDETPPAPDETPPAPVESPPADSPLISWTPSADTAPGPVVGWAAPPTIAPETGVEGYVVAGVGARLVAYWIDAFVVGIFPAILTLVTIDWVAIMRAAAEQAAANAPGTSPYVLPITLEVVLVTVINVGISYLYFVGMWTGPGQATLGMRGLRMRVVDASGGGTLSVLAASKRWVALGAPLGLLSLVAPLASVAGLTSLGLSAALLLTTATDARRQGLHDKWAGSAVIRSASSGAGATAAGCLVLAGLAIGISIVFAVIVGNEVLPYMDEIMRDLRNTT
jgi:uncharacterized RDD family membrane protein YckC